MKVLVIGSGASGALIGARLIERKADVTFVVRPERKLQLVTTGLQLRSQFGRFRKPVQAITPDEIHEQADLIIVTVRAQDFEIALELAAPAIGPHTIVLPIAEGVRPIEVALENRSPRVIVGVLEARLLLDADGIASQRPPASELAIGALHPRDEPMAHELARLLNGRGLHSTYCPRIQCKAWERFAFMAGAAATSVLMRRPLRDALRFAHGAGTLAAALQEAFQVGVAAGYAPDQIAVRAYEKSFLLEGRPVQPPSLISAGGRAGDEATCLLGEMVCIARRARVNARTFSTAWRILTRPTEIDLSAEDVSEVT